MGKMKCNHTVYWTRVSLALPTAEHMMNTWVPLSAWSMRDQLSVLDLSCIQFFKQIDEKKIQALQRAAPISRGAKRLRDKCQVIFNSHGKEMQIHSCNLLDSFAALFNCFFSLLPIFLGKASVCTWIPLLQIIPPLRVRNAWSMLTNRSYKVVFIISYKIIFPKFGFLPKM